MTDKARKPQKPLEFIDWSEPLPDPRTMLGKNASLDERQHYIDVKTGHGDYSIPLSRCGTPAQVLDWIFQIKRKTWATPNVVYDLLTAFDVACEVYHNKPVQGCLCSFGAPSSVTFPG